MAAAPELAKKIKLDHASLFLAGAQGVVHAFFKLNFGSEQRSDVPETKFYLLRNVGMGVVLSLRAQVFTRELES
jgi:hypothetical protein